ncbi:hypothetical protein CU048_04465 [Beijerinckiaceae bacterium]|nr:hypothetical protein CU048_04465 [Beijerinckiaceae bacterium]
MKSAQLALVNYLTALRSSLDARAFVADCYSFTLRTGLNLTYTNADVPVSLNGYTYAANSVLVDGLRFKCAAGLDVDQQQISISARAVDTVGGVPFLQALRNGVFDGCAIQRERAFLNSFSPADLATPIGSVILFKGRIGTVDSVGRTSAQVTVNSALVLLDLQMPRNVYSPACQHVLYDSGCGLVKSAFGASGTVGAGSDTTTILWPSSSAIYAQGTLVFSSGINLGVTANIKTAQPGLLRLSYPLLHAPSPGDAFTVYQGCDHTQATCQGKFNNLANFRGFPYSPTPTYAI